MQHNEKIEYLQSYRSLWDQFIYLNNQIKGLKGISYEDGAGGRKKTINELIDQKSKVIERMEEIEKFVESIENEQLRWVIGYRYLQFKTVEEVSKILGYSREWVSRTTKRL